MTQIEVKVTKYKDRTFWLMYYDDPVTGKRESRSTRAKTKDMALKAAAVWEDELRTGRYKPVSAITWQDFRERYETEVLASLAPRTLEVVATVFGHLESILKPEKLSALTADRLSHFQKELRSGNEDPKTKIRKSRSESTVKSYLAHLKASLRWAVDMGMLHELPKVTMPKRAKGGKVMKGRPITTEEFERMLAKVEATLFDRPKKDDKKMKMSAPKLSDATKAEIIASWQKLLRGLWLSGLRLGESLDLYWDDETKLTVDFTGRRPMFRILAELEKGNEDRVLPMTPDFAEFLQTIPADQRTGPVFSLLGVHGRELARDMDWISRVIARIGRAAGVVVNRTPAGEVKYASAHDLRRSFGARWAHRVMPTVLQQLMRHGDIDTTLKYYVGQNADNVADAIWKAAAVGESQTTSPVLTTSPV